MTDADLVRQLRGERLTTAEVLYYMPDHPMLLQSFLWQTLDFPPDFPKVHKFLIFWRREIDAVLKEGSFVTDSGEQLTHRVTEYAHQLATTVSPASMSRSMPRRASGGFVRRASADCSERASAGPRSSGRPRGPRGRLVITG